MKKIYLLAILAMGASSVFGQGKLDLRSLEVLRQYQAQTVGMQKTQAAEPKMVTAVVRLSGDNAVAALQKKGIEVLRQRDDLAIVQLPMDSVESVVASDALHQMRCARCSSHVLCVRNLTKPTSRQAPTKCIKEPISTVHIQERA